MQGHAGPLSPDGIRLPSQITPGSRMPARQEAADSGHFTLRFCTVTLL